MSTPKIIWQGLLMVIVSAAVAQGQMPESAMSVTAQTTYGAYTGSKERQGYASAVLSASYQRTPDFSLGLMVRKARLRRRGGLRDINQSDYAIALQEKKALNAQGYIGLWGGAFHIQSDDDDADKMVVPYAALAGRIPGSSVYLDGGFAQSDYDSARIRQCFATMGFEFFHPSLFARTRVYHIQSDKAVEGRESTLAVEHKLIWYADPDHWTVTMAGLWGCRVHAFDPDIQAAYTLPDLQKGSGSLTVFHNLLPSLDIFVDATWEAYSKPSEGNDYSVFYGTFGLTYTF